MRASSKRNRLLSCARMKRRAERHNGKSTAVSGANATRFAYSTLCTLSGGLLLWAAFPPVGWSWCAWVAPVPWLLLARNRQPIAGRSYWGIWIGSVVFWLALLQGIRKAHWANNFSLLALSFYVAAYLPAFIAGVRCAVHYSRIPLLLVAPVVWTGLELLRGYLFTGFSVGLLGHTQVNHLWLIQISDVTGAYGVSFLVMLCAACLTEMWLGFRTNRRWLPVAVAIAGLGGTCGYGWWRVQTTPKPSDQPLRVALLQGTRDKVFVTNPQLEEESFEQYRELMKRARDADPDVDLIVWPEGAFTGNFPEVIVDGPFQPPPGIPFSLDKFNERQQRFAEKVRVVAEEANHIWQNGELRKRDVDLVVGVTSVELRGADAFLHNSVLWIDPAGRISGRYHKMHPVMFGEYVPFISAWPWLARQTPIGLGLTPGDGPVSFAVHGYRLVPSICFESTVPQLIRKQVRRLANETGQSPDVLVNVTDDGWFWGSSILDLHLACAVYRAVELRRPFLVAANTGISAAIDGNGRVQERLPHRAEGGFILATISRDGRFSLYERWGDLFAGVCLLASLWWTARGWILRRKDSGTWYAVRRYGVRSTE